MKESRASLWAWTWCVAALLALGGCDGAPAASAADGGGQGRGVDVGAPDADGEGDSGGVVPKADAAMPVGCDDGDPCTINDSSPAPGCQPAVLNCDDGKDCTSDSCAQGKCVHAVVADCNACSSDWDCSDGDICTFDQCKDGSCAYPPITGCKACSLAADCDDGDACTLDKCQGTMCAHVTLEGCKSCAADATCDDANGCTSDSCEEGKCAYAAVPGCKACSVDWECNDGDPCSVEFCIAKACSYSPATACLPCTQASDCSDGLACTIDTCQAGKCHFNPTYCAAGPYDKNPPQLPIAAGLPALPVVAGMGPLPSCPAGAGAKGDGTVLAGGGLGCKTCCGPLANALSWRCAFGACLVEQCKAGWHDDNGDGADGCETPWQGACDLYVAQTLTFAGADGSADHPFPTLVQAAQAAQPGCRIHVGPGLFFGEVKLDGVRLIGAGPDKTVLARSWKLSSPASQKETMGLRATQSSVEGIRLVSSAAEMTGTASAPARVRWSAFGSTEWDIFAVPFFPPGLAVASPHAVISLVRVGDVKVGDYACGGAESYSPSHSVGLSMIDSPASLVTGVVVDNLKGWGSLGSYSNGKFCIYTFNAGNAVGLAVSGAAPMRIRNSRISNLQAGKGHALVGYKGEYEPAHHGRRIGLEASGPLVVDEVQVEGQPLHYAYQRDGYAVSGGAFDPTLHHTSQGHIYIAKSKGVSVSNLVAGGPAPALGDDKDRANGIHIAECADVTITNNVLVGVTTAVTVTGTAGVKVAGNTFTGLKGNGVVVESSANAVVTGNNIDGAKGDGLRFADSKAQVTANKLNAVEGIGIDFSESQGKVTGNQVGPGPKLGVRFVGCPSCLPIISGGNTVGAGMIISHSPGFVSTGDSVTGGTQRWKGETKFGINFDATAYGVLVYESPAAVFTDLRIAGVTGFSGALCGSASGLTQGSGGAAKGLTIAYSNNVVVGPARIDSIAGGATGTFWDCPNVPAVFSDGSARGIEARKSEGLVLRNILIGSIAQPQYSGTSWTTVEPEPLDVVGQCLATDASATVDHLTCIATDHPLVTPILADDWSNSAFISLRNSIISGGGACTKGNVDASWSDFFACDLPAKVCPSGTCLSADPLLDPKAPLPYSPICTAQQCSPAINAGDPKAPYCAEPAPNGCRADLGWTGNSKGASAKPGAAHCGCVP